MGSAPALVGIQRLDVAPRTQVPEPLRLPAGALTAPVRINAKTANLRERTDTAVDFCGHCTNRPLTRRGNRRMFRVTLRKEVIRAEFRLIPK
jgi:hypothetical protein